MNNDDVHFSCFFDDIPYLLNGCSKGQPYNYRFYQLSGYAGKT
jgi:hypothetical protein